MKKKNTYEHLPLDSSILHRIIVRRRPVVRLLLLLPQSTTCVHRTLLSPVSLFPCACCFMYSFGLVAYEVAFCTVIEDPTPENTHSNALRTFWNDFVTIKMQRPTIPKDSPVFFVRMILLMHKNILNFCLLELH